MPIKQKKLLVVVEIEQVANGYTFTTADQEIYVCEGITNIDYASFGKIMLDLFRKEIK